MRAQGALERLLAGRFRDPDGGGTLDVPTHHVVIAPNLGGQAASLLNAAGLGRRRWAVVSDENTHPILGALITEALRSATAIVLRHPHADAETVAEIRERAGDADALIAVGSGTINDLCKHAAFLDRKPYVVFGTAPSMNGYTSPTAAITVQGHKKSLPAAAPAAVFLDLQVLVQAPARLIRAGIGDSLCRSTAQTDWLLAHLLHNEPYREAPFALLREEEGPLFAAAGGLPSGDLGAMRLLARTLVLSGYGMAICGSSMPASQSEHLISHYADMMGAVSSPASFHGEQIGVTTLTVARLQEKLLSGPPPRLRPSAPTRAGMVRHFGATLGPACWSEFEKKCLNQAAADAMNARMEAHWPDIQRRVAAIRCPARALESTLNRAGAPTTPEALGWDPAFYNQAVRHAREIRNRWTVLDLAADAGLLDEPHLAVSA